MKFFVIDVDRDGTTISQMKVEEGKYRQILTVSGKSLAEQAGVIAVHILKFRPTKVFVDEIGLGAGLLANLKTEMSEMGLQLQDDGTVVYG